MLAEERLGLPDMLRKREEPAEGPLRQIVRWAVQELMEAEVSTQFGAERYGGTDERSTQRSRHRLRTGGLRVGAWNGRARTCGRAATARVGWSHGGERRQPWSRWWPKRTYRG
jgi:hypothetical protein